MKFNIEKCMVSTVILNLKKHPLLSEYYLVLHNYKPTTVTNTK